MGWAFSIWKESIVEIQIDEEFKSLIPPLSPEEFKQLEENILQDGCRDPLVVWVRQGFKTCGKCGELFSGSDPDDLVHCRHCDHHYLAGGECSNCHKKLPKKSDMVTGDAIYTLLDGHNRFEICSRHDIHFNVIKLDFESREDAKDWMDRNQLGRRNLTPEQMSLLRGRRYNRLKKSHGGQIPNSRIVQNELSSTAEVLAEQHGVSEATIKRDGQFAEAVEVLGMEADILSGAVDAPKQAIVEAAKPIIDAKKQHEKWQNEVKDKPLAAPPEPPKPTQEDIQKARAHVANNSGENEWYTPKEYIDAARSVLGVIDTDPASCKLANETVKASTYFTKEQDGLTKRWCGNVWMNPPYAQPLIGQFAEAVASKYEQGEISQAIVLVNNATETAWFSRMLQSASAVCFPKGRIKFIDKEGRPSGAPLQGQAFLYFGKQFTQFADSFSHFGKVLFNEQ